MRIQSTIHQSADGEMTITFRRDGAVVGVGMDAKAIFGALSMINRPRWISRSDVVRAALMLAAFREREE